MVELTDAELAAAAERGRKARETEPRAASARYDRRRRRVVVELTNGASFMFPVTAAQFLADASDDDLAEVEIVANGFGLHWETLDVDYTVPGLLAGIFGTAKFMARQAGRGRSEAKAAAARANGAKGGRPRKTARG